MSQTIRQHWPEYLMEGAGLGLFMVSAGLWATVLEHPSSPLYQLLPDPIHRRGLMGLGLGLTSISIIYSPWGQQSGAHFNPAITLTFFRLGKVSLWDALWYMLAHFVGALIGLSLVSLVIGQYLAAPSVRCVVTVPGAYGFGPAFLAEIVISFGLMLLILYSTNEPTLARWTGVLAGVLIAAYFTIESPISGMSMNPARTFSSAVCGWLWEGLWIYFLAPPLGMLLAAELFLLVTGWGGVICAKLHHVNAKRCIFHCGYRLRHGREAGRAPLSE